ncbi:TonB family protein [Labilibacter sediminis]|nr:TonB family protein [Labilibacter sediminis]
MKTILLLFSILIIVSLVPVSTVLANNTYQSADSVYTTVDKVPVLKQNRGNVQKYLAKHIQYPVDALAKEIEGKVLVSFVITPQGKLINAQVEKELYESLNKEALRVIGTMQDWKPGEINGTAVNTKVTIPVHFILSDDNKALAQQLKPFYANDKPPMFVLDNKKVIGLTKLEYYNIKSIRVMKGEKAVALYGKGAENGVVIIETKRGTSPDYQMY